MSDPQDFAQEVRNAARSFPWIQRIEPTIIGKIARIRLWLNQDFVDIYYNAQTGSISYAYIEQGERKFGANNMRVGWHLHPFGAVSAHQSIPPLSPQEFFQRLEEELKRYKKI